MYLCTIDEKYINYLKQFENNIYYNSKDKDRTTRKYLSLGIVIKLSDFNYFIPLSSPKEKDYKNRSKNIIRSSTMSIIRMVKNGINGKQLLGTLRISNMIPASILSITKYDVEKETNQKYKALVEDELFYIFNHKKDIIEKANIVYYQKISHFTYEYLNSCLDYKLLEEKCLCYEKSLNNNISNL